MVTIVKALLEWVSLGPLKGYRTQILSAILFLLGGLKLSGVLTGHLDEQTYTAIVTILSGAIGATAANHKP